MRFIFTETPFTTAGIRAGFRTHERTEGRTADGRTEEGQTDVEVEIVI